MKDKALSTIPFSGFYETIHDEELDRALESVFQDRQTGDPNQGLVNRATCGANFGPAFQAYAKEYAEQFGDKFEIKLEFDELRSPKEYNFDTDRIFVYIDWASVQKMRDQTDEKELRELAREKFTSRSGFHSFYDPDIDEWGDLETWDHNQIGTLVEAWANQECQRDDGFDMWAEADLMEHACCNGMLEDWVLQGLPEDLKKRLLKVHDYIEDRKER